MKNVDPKFVAAVVVACLLGLGICLLGSQQASISQQVDLAVQAASSPVVQEQVINLPEDGGTYHTVLLLHADWRNRPNERELVAWFKTEPALVSLAAQTHYWQITDADPIYASNYAATTPTLPAVLVQTEDGRAIYKVSGDEIPSAGAVASDVVQLFDKRPWLRLRPWKRPRPAPTPAPEPKPEPKPDVDVKINTQIPVVRPPQEPSGQGADFWAILGISIVVAGCVAIAWQLRSRLS